jgi:hypothetical protein
MWLLMPLMAIMPTAAIISIRRYTSKLQLTPAGSTSDKKPAISSGGVVSASAFNAQAGGALGTWLEIFGSNLATTTRLWDSSDFNGNKAPTALDGVSVTIGGINVYVDYVSPGTFVVNGKSNIVATFPISDPNNIVYVGNTGAVSRTGP